MSDAIQDVENEASRYDDIDLLLKSIHDIVYNKTSIAHLSNIITYGSMSENKGFVPSHGGMQMTVNTAWVRIVRLNKVFIKKFLNYSRRSIHNSSYDDPNRHPYIHLYNNKYNSSSCRESVEDGNFYKYLGSNIYRDINIAGYHYNACDIYNSLAIEEEDRFDRNKYGMTNENSKHITKYAYKLLFISEKNFLIGLIDRNGILYLDHVLLIKILKSNTELFKKIIENIFDVYSNVNSIFFNMHISDVSVDIIERVARRILMTLPTDVQNCSVIKDECLDIFQDNNILINHLNNIRDMIKNEVNSYLKSTFWGVNNQFSYHNLIQKLYAAKYQVDKIAIEQAFSNGLLFANKFELSGWTVSEMTFNDCMTWEKEVNIVPSKMCYKKEIYTINNEDPNWKNPYLVKKIYVNTKGVMYCDGKHPNVSGQNVCMGDLRGMIDLSDPKKLGENLNRCEALLTLINYDSAYEHTHEKEILQHSTKDTGGSFDIDKEYVGDNIVLTDVTYEDDEDRMEVGDDTQDNTQIINDIGPTEEIVETVAEQSEESNNG